jgi:hypothetical protein
MSLRAVPDLHRPRIGGTLSPDQVSAIVQDYVSQAGGLKPAGKRWKVSAQMVSMVVRGLRRPTNSMLRTLGLEELPPETIDALRRKAPAYRRVK